MLIRFNPEKYLNEADRQEYRQIKQRVSFSRSLEDIKKARMRMDFLIKKAYARKVLQEENIQQQSRERQRA